MITSIFTNPVTMVGLLVWAIVVAAGTYVALGRITPSTADDDERDDIVKRVLRNSAIPIASQLFIRVADLAVAIVLLRLLGPEGNGRYALAVVVWLYVKTISDFGLTLLATRDIARDRAIAGGLVGATTLLRILILAIAAIPVGIYVGIGMTTDTVSPESAMAIGILYLSIIPSSFAEAANSALNGFQRMDVAAWINIGVSLVRAPLVIVLAATQFGVIGVALAALAAGVLSADLFRRAFNRVTMQKVHWNLNRDRALSLARESWPLLINALLINLFFRVDVFLVQSFKGDAALGVYDASYKLINLVTIIPAYATLAIFPAMAIRSGDHIALARAQRMSSYLLVWVAWAIVAGVTATAGTAIRILAGNEYLPEAAVLLRMLIWFAPLSCLNGVMQYVLVAAGQQRRIIPAFTSAVVFNAGANVFLVPIYGARAAAVVTVVTEVVILAAFAVVTRKGPIHVVSRDTIGQIWRPTIAGIGTTVVVLPFALRVNELMAAGVGIALFAGLTLATGVLGPAERDLLRRAMARRAPAQPA